MVALLSLMPGSAQGQTGQEFEPRPCQDPSGAGPMPAERDEVLCYFDRAGVLVFWVKQSRGLGSLTRRVTGYAEVLRVQREYNTWVRLQPQAAPENFKFHFIPTYDPRETQRLLERIERDRLLEPYPGAFKNLPRPAPSPPLNFLPASPGGYWPRASGCGPASAPRQAPDRLTENGELSLHVLRIPYYKAEWRRQLLLRELLNDCWRTWGASGSACDSISHFDGWGIEVSSRFGVRRESFPDDLERRAQNLYDSRQAAKEHYAITCELLPEDRKNDWPDAEPLEPNEIPAQVKRRLGQVEYLMQSHLATAETLQKAYRQQRPNLFAP